MNINPVNPSIVDLEPTQPDLGDGEVFPEQTINVVPQPKHQLDTLSALAYYYWEQRGRPEGSPKEDWLAAERTLLWPRR